LAGEFHAPSLPDFFPPAVLFAGTPFELDCLMVIRVLVSVVLLGVMVLAFRGPRLVPRGLRNVAEFGR
jgi:F-type H+-transporting ATPase subunit a